VKTFLIILALLLAVVLQTSLLPFLAVLEVTPNLVLVLVLLLIIFRGFGKVWVGLVSAGLFLDFFSGLPFGLISLSLVIAAALVDWFNKNFFSAIKFWIVAILIALGTLIYDFFLISLTKIFQVEVTIAIEYLALEVAYNLLVAVIFFYGIKKIFRQE